MLYPTYETDPDDLYVDVFEPIQTVDSQVYWNVAGGWDPLHQIDIDIPAPLGPATFNVQVALVENDKDARPLIVTVTAGEGINAVSQTQMPTVPNMGDLLNILEFTLVNVPAGTSTIVVTIESPAPYTHGLGAQGGDSGAIIGITANYACVETENPFGN